MRIMGLDVGSKTVGEVKFRFWPLDKIGTVEDN